MYYDVYFDTTCNILSRYDTVQPCFATGANIARCITYETKPVTD